jgi:predicted phage baseplate assembly protein
VSSTDELTLDNCGCCEPDPLPAVIYNRPGLPALQYRVGTYSLFLRRMLNRISAYALPDGDHKGNRPLVPLSTRELDDPSIALLDASAIVADVLTFYQERIANEGFLRTSMERLSILELARAIGYELSPGVAASTYLAFTIEDAPGGPALAEIPVGTKVQSVPPQGKLPQTFETVEGITAHPGWNAIRPRLTKPQHITTDIKYLYLAGTSTNLKVGDRLLIKVEGNDGIKAALRQVEQVTVDQNHKRTEIVLVGLGPIVGRDDVALPVDTFETATASAFSGDQVVSNVVQKTWQHEGLNAYLTFNAWDPQETSVFVDEHHKRNPKASGTVYAMRAIVGFFGHNAPLRKSVPTYPGQDWDPELPFFGWPIWKDQQSDPVTDPAVAAFYGSPDVYLERVVEGILPDSWLVIDTNRNTGPRYLYYQINSVIERSVAAFALNGKLTGLELKVLDGGALRDVEDTESDKRIDFVIRKCVAYLKSEQLPLTERPLTDNLLQGQVLLQLNGLLLGLKAGQVLILTGERADAEGLTASEVHFIKDISHSGGYTELTLESGLKHSYKRETVTINANVARATHGETTSQILGNGSGAQPNQRFTLNKSPLTHISAPTPSGTASTLEVRANDLLWSEASSLYPLGPNDQSYVLRLGEDGKSTVIFGDGKRGSRLPTGSNNVVARYRSGIGLDGEVKEGTLTMLASRPLGVKGVTNPLPAAGADDPEKMEDARKNAPLTVRTLGRIVSPGDYEDAAQSFAGIGKAQAIELWVGEVHLVHLTVAGANGEPIGADSELHANLVAGINQARDSAQRFRVDSFLELPFNLHANVAVDKRYIVKDVFTKIQTALQTTFSFPMRSFGQAVTAAEVVATIQKNEGVIAVDLDALYLSSQAVGLNSLLSAQIARVEDGIVLLAQLLLINLAGIQLAEMQT